MAAVQSTGTVQRSPHTANVSHHKSTVNNNAMQHSDVSDTETEPLNNDTHTKQRHNNNNINNELPYAPLYRPTIDEFRNPYTYIHSIRDDAMKYGICKIVPPPEWKFEKNFDWHTNKFVTKIQYINQLQSRATPDTVDSYTDSIDELLQHKHSGSDSDDNMFVDTTVQHDSTPVKQYSDISEVSTSTHKRARAKPNRFVEQQSNEKLHSNDKTKRSNKKSKKSKLQHINDHSTTMCSVCNGGHHDDRMLLCDNCDNGVHMFCLTRPLTTVPDGDWYCSDCQAEREHWFGFGTGGEYTLAEFKQYADKYFDSYFNKYKNYNNNIQHSNIVNEYWSIVENANHTKPVTVRYGSDVDTQQFGTGYPTTGQYAADGWNLNNLALLPESMLSFLDASTISGVTIPWLYIGMIFSSFCWHNEDQYCHSINYIHYGSSKQWYGIPSSSAHIFEQLMCDYNPEMFQSCPDLLFHLVTMLSPNRLVHNTLPNTDIQLYQCVQNEGEIVLTFPQAYHAGFNCGFNIAESVNFACNDWLAMGMKCLDRWRCFRRAQCFNTDRLVCNLAQKYLLQQQQQCLTTYQNTVIKLENNTRDVLTAAAGKGYISTETAAWLLPVMKRLRDREKRGREILYKLGIQRSKYWVHDETTTKKQHKRISMSAHIPNQDMVTNDTQAYCIICKHYLWLSCVVCTCQPNKHACLAHSAELCECSNTHKIIYFRYDLAQLNDYINVLEDSVYSDSSKNYAQIVQQSQAILDTVDQYPKFVNVHDDRLALLDTDNDTLQQSNDTVTIKKSKHKKSNSVISISDTIWSKLDYTNYYNKSQQWCAQIDAVLRDIQYATINNDILIQYQQLLEHGEHYIWNDTRYSNCRRYYDKLLQLYTVIQQNTTQCCKLYKIFQQNKEYSKELHDKIYKPNNTKHKQYSTQFTQELYHYYDIIPGKISYSDAKRLLHSIQQYTDYICTTCHINHTTQVNNWLRFIDALQSDDVVFHSLNEIVICIQTCIKIPIQIITIQKLFQQLLKFLTHLKPSTVTKQTDTELHTWNQLVSTLHTTTHSITSIKKLHTRSNQFVITDTNSTTIESNRDKLQESLEHHKLYVYCTQRLLNTTKQYSIEYIDTADIKEYKCVTCKQDYFDTTITAYKLCCWEYIESYWLKHANITDYSIAALKLLLQQYTVLYKDILDILPLRLQVLFVSKHKINTSNTAIHIDELIQLYEQLYKYNIIIQCSTNVITTVVQEHINMCQKWQYSNRAVIQDLYTQFDKLLCNRTDKKLETQLLSETKLILSQASNLHIISNETLLTVELLNKIQLLKTVPETKIIKK